MKLAILAVVASTAFFACASDKQVTATELEREILKRTDLQMTTAGLQAQTKYQQDIAAPQAEQHAIYDKLCKAAKVAIDVCVIDRTTGAVAKQAEQPQPKK